MTTTSILPPPQVGQVGRQVHLFQVSPPAQVSLEDQASLQALSSPKMEKSEIYNHVVYDFD